MSGPGVWTLRGDTRVAWYQEINFSCSANCQWPESPESSTRCPEYFDIQVCRKLQRGGSERMVASLLQAILGMWDLICTWVWQLFSAKSMMGSGIDLSLLPLKGLSHLFFHVIKERCLVCCLYLFCGIFTLSVSNTCASADLSVLPSLRFRVHVKPVVILGSNSWVSALDFKIHFWASFQIIHLYAVEVLWRYKVPCYR